MGPVTSETPKTCGAQCVPRFSPDVSPAGRARVQTLDAQVQTGAPAKSTVTEQWEDSQVHVLEASVLGWHLLHFDELLLESRHWDTRLSYLTVYKFRIVFGTRRSRPRIVRNRCVQVCGIFWAWFGSALGQNPAPDLDKFSGPF